MRRAAQARVLRSTARRAETTGDPGRLDDVRRLNHLGR